MRVRLAAQTAGLLFQSAPGFAAGRCRLRTTARNTINRFNPLPALQPGDATYNPECRSNTPVSIRSRLCSREMPPYRQRGRLGLSVSIRSRLCSREMLARRRRETLHHWFQSAPGFAAGRCTAAMITSSKPTCFNPLPALQPGDAIQRPANIRAFCGFNPLPALQPGDAVGWVERYPRCARFNPLPALQPGDARDWGYDALCMTVSIRSRLCSREMRAAMAVQAITSRVSIRSRLCSREMPKCRY